MMRHFGEFLYWGEREKGCVLGWWNFCTGEFVVLLMKGRKVAGFVKLVGTERL